MKKEVRVSLCSNISANSEHNLPYPEPLPSQGLPEPCTSNTLSRMQHCLKQYVLSNAKIGTNKSSETPK